MKEDCPKCDLLFNKIFTLDLKDLPSNVQVQIVQFLIYCFQSISEDIVRSSCLKTVSLHIWKHIDPRVLNTIFNEHPRIRNAWKKHVEKSNKSYYPDFLYNLIGHCISQIEQSDWSPDNILFVEKFLELLIDLISQLPTRRFLRLLIESCHFLVIGKNSNLAKSSNGKLFNQLLDILDFYIKFEIDDFTGNEIEYNDFVKNHYEKIEKIQLSAFMFFDGDMKTFSLANVASLDSKFKLSQYLSSISDEKLIEFCRTLLILKEDEILPRELLLDELARLFERRKSHLDEINNTSIYPSENSLWDYNLAPNTYRYGSLALPKLNLQFLTMHDQLLRNYTLYRAESISSIRDDLEMSIKRMKPRISRSDTTIFTGWSRMAIPIQGFKITNVLKADIGDSYPSLVTGEVSFKIPSRVSDEKKEWEGLKPREVLFFLTIKATVLDGVEITDESKDSFKKLYGVQYLRCGEILETVDSEGNTILPGASTNTHMRTLKVVMDPVQYQFDTDNILDTHSTGTPNEMIYNTFNLMIRRKSKENNFKAVLETIRDLMNSKRSVPEWMADVFLGFGDPESCTHIEDSKILDFVDTFVSSDHLISSFPGHEVNIEGDLNGHSRYKVTFDSQQTLAVRPYNPKLVTPYPNQTISRNSIRFTPKQVEVIKSSMNKGLTMVVGPPGTGKTDVAVQILSNWYHNFPTERTLIVTHSNNALNQIFEKVACLDLDERYMVRLGQGGNYLETTKDFSKAGRVAYLLQLRLDLLQLVSRLCIALSKPTDIAYSCETALSFYKFDVVSRWEKFNHELTNLSDSDRNAEMIAKIFPFTRFFFDCPQPLFDLDCTYEELYDKSVTCYEYIKKIFEQLEECRPFELLRSNYDRENHIVMKQAKVIAMTCTHAALKRAQLVELGFKFDNILIEEAAQILEIETVIPLLLQESPMNTSNRLKRVVLLGDHNQLPPIVQNITLQKYCHFDQSLFTRFIRLGVPFITLDYQGRSRPSLSELYKWNYKDLKDLDNVITGKEFVLANPGFAYDYQLIDVPEFHGMGESMPTPHFYQNLGEAEYIVAVYMYMRMLGYPKEKISIITTYNGQKSLIRDIVRTRCSDDERYGWPSKITTVDRYQGQQNDYVLLSLVRTKTVGHIRDIRRLIVSMSRARLGLYIFCRQDIFKDCYELSKIFSILGKRPSNLMLVKGESYSTSFERTLDDPIPDDSLLKVENIFHMGQIIE